MNCSACGKRLPASDRYCAYCGTVQGWRLLPGVRLALPAWPVRWLPIALAGAGLGALVGGLAGALLEAAWPGLILGAVAVAASGVLGEVSAGAIPDRASGERFGRTMGLLGGGLVLIGGLLASLAIMLGANEPGGSVMAQLGRGLNVGLIAGAVGALAGAAAGWLLGGWTGGLGYRLLRRRGAILGASLAWAVGAALGGLVAGDYAARVAGAAPVASAGLGITVQVLLGALLLVPVRRLQRRWRHWRTSRP
jgi:hypothetical protein